MIPFSCHPLPTAALEGPEDDAAVCKRVALVNADGPRALVESPEETDALGPDERQYQEHQLVLWEEIRLDNLSDKAHPSLMIANACTNSNRGQRYQHQE